MLGGNTVGGKRYLYPRVIVNMTDRDVIERVAQMFGTSVYAIPVQPERKPSFRAQVNGSRAAQWMARLRPWLGERRGAKVDEILAAYGSL